MSRGVVRKFSESRLHRVLVRGAMVKLNNTTKYVELYVEDLRTRVRFPPVPPSIKHETPVKRGFLLSELYSI